MKKLPIKSLKNSRILILDDDPDILELLEYLLKKQGYQVMAISDSKNIESILYENSFSLMIIDRNLPCIEGTELVKKLRDLGENRPVIFLTAKNSQEEKLEGFENGGDDYITKPFDNKELVFRISALIKRTRKSGFQNILIHRDIIINLDLLDVKIDNSPIKLTKLELKLLQTFMENKNRVLDRDYLLDTVWNCGVFDEHCNEKSVNVAIKRLRLKIDKNNSKKYFESIRGIGYKLI